MHPGGVQTVFCDGSVHWIDDNIQVGTATSLGYWEMLFLSADGKDLPPTPTTTTIRNLHPPGRSRRSGAPCLTSPEQPPSQRLRATLRYAPSGSGCLTYGCCCQAEA